MKVSGYPWGGGLLGADGTFDSSGTGMVALQRLEAGGAFSGQGIAFNGSDVFSALSGQFTFAFDGNSPSLKLIKVEGRQHETVWSGEGATLPDGKIHLDLSDGERQLHLVSEFAPTNTESAANRP